MICSYQFDDEKKVRMREMGSHFTLKLKWLHTGMILGLRVSRKKKGTTGHLQN